MDGLQVWFRWHSVVLLKMTPHLQIIFEYSLGSFKLKKAKYIRIHTDVDALIQILEWQVP